MCGRIFLLYLLRLLILMLSAGTLACHVVQIILLGQQQEIGPWWPDYVPYILYYVGPIVSILSTIILLLLACFTKSLWNDRVMSVINLLLFIAIIVYNSLQSGMIPFTGTVSKPFISNAKGWVSYCPNYSGLTSIRCWLVNGTWLGMIVTGFLWLLLALYSVVQRNSDIYNEDYDTYDYKEDVPMAARNSSSIQQPQHPPYMSPTTPHHHVYNNTPPVDNNQAYYYQQQPMYDTNNDFNNEYYLNPVQEEHLNNHSHHTQATAALDADNGYERSRKTSKTYLEDEITHHPVPNKSSPVQPPHSYGN